MNSTTNKPFSKTFEINYTSLNPDYTATYVQLLSIAQETSLAHAAAVGHNAGYFLETKKGWVLTRRDACFHRYPQWGERVVSSTWPTSFKGFVGERAFKIETESGELVMTAQTSWIYFDFLSRAPLRPEKDALTPYFPLLPPAQDHDYATINPFDPPLQKISSVARTVRRSDIDTNLHLNNIAYIQWARDAAPPDFPDKISRLKITYKKEATLSERLLIDSYHSPNTLSHRLKTEKSNPIAAIDLIP